MNQNVHAQVAALRKMTPSELREKYLEVFGETTRSGNKQFLCKRLAWRIQSQAEGGAYFTGAALTHRPVNKEPRRPKVAGFFRCTIGIQAR